MMQMKTSFYFFVVIALLFSCSDENAGEFDGLYSGTFYRVRDGVKGETSNVTLNLLDNKYNGSSTLIKYPAICPGEFSVTGSEIVFRNACLWTAEFDWTLILEGKFEATRNGNELILSKKFNDENVDYYVLHKQ
jgi:hypothetical protein